MEKVTIKSIFRDAITTKRGPATKVSIYTAEHGDTKMTSFDSTKTASWKAGDVVEITVIPNGNFMNFKVGDVKSSSTGSSPDVERRLKKLEEAVFGPTDEKVVQTEDKTEDYNNSDVF